MLRRGGRGAALIDLCRGWEPKTSDRMMGCPDSVYLPILSANFYTKGGSLMSTDWMTLGSCTITPPWIPYVTEGDDDGMYPTMVGDEMCGSGGLLSPARTMGVDR